MWSRSRGVPLSAGVAEGPVPPPMFTPLRLRGLELPNRVAVSPMCQYSAEDGTPNDWHLVHLGSRAVGGAGLVIFEATGVEPRGRISPADLGLWEDGQVEPLARVLQNLGCEACWICHGEGGLDEIVPTGTTWISELRDGRIASFTLTTMMSPMEAYFRLLPPRTLMHWTRRAPELSATSRWDCIWIMV